jgi:phage tail-like protein
MSMEQKLYYDQTHPAFRYVVVHGSDALGAFTECTLPVVEWEIEEIKEGGLNSYTHQLPGRRKSARVTLKNGVGKNVILEWFLQTMNEETPGEKLRRNLSIKLKDVRSEDVCTWELTAAFPVKWTGPQLQSDSNALAIQTLELACSRVTVALATTKLASGQSMTGDLGRQPRTG